MDATRLPGRRVYRDLCAAQLAAKQYGSRLESSLLREVIRAEEVEMDVGIFHTRADRRGPVPDVRLRSD